MHIKWSQEAPRARPFFVFFAVCTFCTRKRYVHDLLAKPKPTTQRTEAEEAIQSNMKPWRRIVEDRNNNTTTVRGGRRTARRRRGKSTVEERSDIGHRYVQLLWNNAVVVIPLAARIFCRCHTLGRTISFVFGRMDRTDPFRFIVVIPSATPIHFVSSSCRRTLIPVVVLPLPLPRI